MFGSLANYLTRSAVEKQNLKRQKQFLNWDKVEKIALILDDTQPINKSELDKFIDSTKKYVDVFFLELNSKQASFGNWICFTAKDKTFLKLPKNHVELTLKNRQYQLVINVTEKYALFAAVLISQINSTYICGTQNLFGEVDLIIEKKENTALIPYLNQVMKYLAMIRTN